MGNNVEEYVTWEVAYECIINGGKAQFKGWNPNSFIVMNNEGKIRFENGCQCYLESEELTEKGWLIVPTGRVLDQFDKSPNFAKILTSNLVKVTLLRLKARLQREVYDYYESMNSLLLFGSHSGGYTIGSDTLGHACVTYDTMKGVANVYSNNYEHVKHMCEKHEKLVSQIMHLEREMFCITHNMYDVCDLKEVYTYTKGIK